MELDVDLIKRALYKIKDERYLQGQLLQYVYAKNYIVATIFYEGYKRLAKETDGLVDKIINKHRDYKIDEIREEIEDVAVEEFGDNCYQDSSLSGMIENRLIRGFLEGDIDESDAYLEEAYYTIHVLAADMYLNAKDGKYKEELLDHINNNISRSNALRALFEGNTDLFFAYNPDMYFDRIDHQVIGGRLLNLAMLSTCLSLEEIYKQGDDQILEMGVSKEDLEDVKKAQLDMEIVTLASIYACATNREIPIDIDYDQYDEEVQENIKKGVNLGIKYLNRISNGKKYIKELD